MEVQVDLKLTDGQKEAWNLIHRDDVRYLVLRWSRQCGKTVLCELLMLEYLFKPNTFNVYISPTFQLGRKVYADITRLLEPTGTIKKANASTLTIETIYGSTLQCYSMEAYTGIRGTTCNGICILDECAYYPDVLPNGEDPWANVVMPITKARKPKVVFVSTPRGKRGTFYQMYLRAVAGEKGYAELSRTIYQDSLVTKEEIEEIKRGISDIAFLQEFMVQFLDSSLTFFKGYEQCFSEYTFNERERIFVGCDLSANGEDATVVTLINESMQVKQYVIEGSLDVKYNRIANIVNSIPRLVAAYLENNGVGAPMIAEIKKLVAHKGKIYEWTTTNSSKEDIVSNMAVRIANKEIFFDKNDNGLFAEFGSFVVKYTKSGKMQFEAQSGKHDDRILSACMALQCKEDFKFTGENKMNFVKMPFKQII